MTDPGGFTPNALKILEARYFLKNEKGEFLDKSPADLFRRVATPSPRRRKSRAGRPRPKPSSRP